MADVVAPRGGGSVCCSEWRFPEVSVACWGERCVGGVVCWGECECLVRWRAEVSVACWVERGGVGDGLVCVGASVSVW